MKSILSFFLCTMLVCPLLSACQGSGNTGTPSESDTDQSVSAGDPSAPAADEVVAREVRGVKDKAFFLYRLTKIYA